MDCEELLRKGEGSASLCLTVKKDEFPEAGVAALVRENGRDEIGGSFAFVESNRTGAAYSYNFTISRARLSSCNMADIP